MELSCWSAFSGGDDEVFNDMAAEFNRTHPGIRILPETISMDEYYADLAGAVAEGRAPDLALIQQSSLLRYVNSGYIRALDDIPAQENLPMDDFMEAPLEACRIGGRLYALPLDIHPLVMFYNTDLFTQAGIEKTPETLNELIQAARAVQNRTGAIGIAADNTAAGNKAWTMTWLFISLLKQQGTDILTEDNTKANFNNSAGEKALSALLDLNQVFKIIPPNLDYDASLEAFRQGKAGMHINGVWASGVFKKQKKLNFVAAPLPPLLGRSAAWAGSHTLALPARQDPDPQRLEAAMTFILWMTERGELWAKTGNIPARKSAAEKPEFLALPFRAAYLEAAQSAVPSPRTPAWDDICDSLSDSLEYAMASSKGIKAILTAMDQKVNEIIAAY
jgi:multiple sugar transport system substrate-binding protein